MIGIDSTKSKSIACVKIDVFDRAQAISPIIPRCINAMIGADKRMFFC